MPEFDSAGVRLHYELTGPDDGDPVVLVHGYASDYRLNWVGSRWQETLSSDGFLVIGLDCRGHGQSEKPHDPAAYGGETMALDVVRLLDHLDIGRSNYLGYSMGAWIGLRLAILQPTRLRRAVLGGVGRLRGFGSSKATAARMRGDSGVEDRVANTFFAFASAQPHNDLEALAAYMDAQHWRPAEAELLDIQVPILVVVGDQDDIAPAGAELAAMIPGAEVVVVPGRNHMNLVPSRPFKEAALEFLETV